MEYAFGLVALVFGTGVAGVGIAWLNDRRIAANARRMPPADPRRILEARFASGEIGEDEFNRASHRLLMGPPLELD